MISRTFHQSGGSKVMIDVTLWQWVCSPAHLSVAREPRRGKPVTCHAGHPGSNRGVEGTVTKCTNMALNSVDCVSTIHCDLHDHVIWRCHLLTYRGCKIPPGAESRITTRAIFKIKLFRNRKAPAHAA